MFRTLIVKRSQKFVWERELPDGDFFPKNLSERQIN
jgi:hypothetical protein